MREKRQARAQLICSEAAQMACEMGFFDLKMSELARRCELSVGTLYSHYPCKEDLLVAVALDALQRQYEQIRRAAELGDSPVQRFIAADLAALRFSCAHPALTELERLAMMPSIWRRSSPGQHQLLVDKFDAVNTYFLEFLQQAARAGEISLSEERLQWLNVGAWSLSMGMDAVSWSNFSVGRWAPALEGHWEPVHRANLVSFLRGWGWVEPEPEAVVARIAAQLPEIPERDGQ